MNELNGVVVDILAVCKRDVSQEIEAGVDGHGSLLDLGGRTYLNYLSCAFDHLLLLVVGADLTLDNDYVAKTNLGCESVDKEGVACVVCDGYGDIAVGIAPSGIDLANGTGYGYVRAVVKTDSLVKSNLNVFGTFNLGLTRLFSR